MNKQTKGYNGYKNYAQWNQSLWLNNDEGLYNEALAFIRKYGNKEDAAARLLQVWNDCGMTHTPDGVKWSKAGILAGLVDM